MCSSENESLGGPNQIMIFGKILCAALYAAAALSLAMEIPFGIGEIARWGSLLFLAAHAAEAVVWFRHLRKYRGPLAVSLLLTLLFGLFHWVPLAKEA
jgi:hypothetical protein